MAEEKPEISPQPAKPHYQSVNDVVQVALNRLREERDQAAKPEPEPEPKKG